MKTRDQEYAAKIHKQVSAVKENFKADECNKYGGMAHQLPILIRTAGLAQALAFLESRKTEGCRQLLNDLSVTVGRPDTLLKDARDVGIGEYMYLTRQVLAALLWYKRFAQSILDIKASDVAKDANLAPVPNVQASDTEAEKR
jgi:CRISPR-associated protein Cmr5